MYQEVEEVEGHGVAEVEEEDWIEEEEEDEDGEEQEEEEDHEDEDQDKEREGEQEREGKIKQTLCQVPSRVVLLIFIPFQLISIRTWSFPSRAMHHLPFTTQECKHYPWFSVLYVKCV